MPTLAQDLRDGAEADIWYDASSHAPSEDSPEFSEDHPDVIAARLIERTQTAMLQAADLLDGVMMKQAPVSRRRMTLTSK